MLANLRNNFVNKFKKIAMYYLESELFQIFIEKEFYIRYNLRCGGIFL